MFRKFLEPKIERRIKSLNELHKYLDERWLARSAEKEMAGKIEQTAFHQTFYQNFSPQNTNLMNSTPRSTRFTAMSMKKINYYTRSRSKVLKRLSTEWPRRIVSKIGYNHLLLQKRMSWRWVEEQRGEIQLQTQYGSENINIAGIIFLGGRFRIVDSIN